MNLIISLLLTLLISYITISLIKNIIGSRTNPYVPNGKFLEALNLDAHQYSLKNWCSLKGYLYNPTTNTCVHTQGSCTNDSNPKYVPCDKCKDPPCCFKINNLDPTKTCSGYNVKGDPSDPNCSCCTDPPPYLEWRSSSTEGRSVGGTKGTGNVGGSEGTGGVCVVSNRSSMLNNTICRKEGLGWYPGSLQCDTDGYCSINDTSNYSGPTCIIDSNYCYKKGMRHHDANQGDCFISDPQAIVESILGKTITRTELINAENMAKQCTHDPFSTNCVLSVGKFMTTPEQIAIKYIYESYKKAIDNAKLKCTQKNLQHSVDSFLGCANAIINFIPGVMLFEQGLQFVDQMLNGLLGMLGLHIGNQFLERAIGYIVKGGVDIVHGVVHAGEDAVRALDQGYYETLQMFRDITNPQALAGDALKLFQTACNLVANLGKDVAIIIIHVGEDAIHLLDHLHKLDKQLALATVHILKSAVGAVIKVGALTQQLLSSTINTIDDLAKGVVNFAKSIGTTVDKVAQESVNAFVHGLSKGSEFVSDEVNAALSEMATEFQKVVKSIEKDFKKIAKDLNPKNWF